MKIFVYFNITNAPYGGSNSFLKALKSEISKYPNFQIVNKIKEKPDVFLYNSFSIGSERVKENIIRNISHFGYPSYFHFLMEGFKKRKVFLVHRVDGITQLYGRMDKEVDDLQLRLNKFADHTIFQSKYCLDSFKTYGYSGNSYSIIHNGVNQEIFNCSNKTFWDGQYPLKVFSCSWSSNPKKGYETIAKVSELDFVESYFVGNWTKGVDPKKVHILNPLTQEELPREYKKCDIFLHPAENDPCPNAVLEALSCGLPVLYHNSGGTPEIVTTRYGTNLNSDLHAVFDEVAKKYDVWVNNLVRNTARFSISHISKKYLSTFLKISNLNGTSYDLLTTEEYSQDDLVG